MEQKIAYPYNQPIRFSAEQKVFFRGFYLNLLWSLTIYIILMVLSFYSFSLFLPEIKAQLTFINYLFSILGMTVLGIIYSFLMVVSVWSVTYDFSHFKEKIFYALVSLNSVRLFLVLRKAWKLNLLHWKPARWTVLDVTLVALTIALFLALNALDTFVLAAIPPLFLSLSLHYLALFFLAYITESFWKTFVAGTISGLILLVFPTTYFISFPQFIFDYLLPTMVFSLSFFIHFQTAKKPLQTMRWAVFVIIPFIFVFISRVIAGMMFYKAAAWSGVPPLLYSVVVNTVNTGFDLVTSLLLVPLVLSRLWVLKNKYQQRNNR